MLASLLLDIDVRMHAARGVVDYGRPRLIPTVSRPHTNDVIPAHLVHHVVSGLLSRGQAKMTSDGY